MKFNWKVVVTLVLMVLAIAWTVNSIRSKSYSGRELSFGVGSGNVTMSNPSEEAVPVQLTAASTRSFAVSSTISDIPPTSVRVGSGLNATSVLEFELPPGDSEFTVTRGSGVKFVSDTLTTLEATVHPPNNNTKVKALALFLLGSLFFMSYITEHRWLYKLLGTEPASKLHSAPYTGEHTERRAYGDNRPNKPG